jgi:transcriptional/translational regulatory protein YebC/TACO1
MFENKGVVTIVGEAIEEDALLEASIEGEGESYDPFSGQDQKGFDLVGFEVKTAPDNLENLESVLKARGFRVWQSETRWFPTNTVAVTDHDQAKALIKMMDTIEDLDDVQSVATNFEMTDDLMAEVMA